jgi:hypothetical protein
MQPLAKQFNRREFGQVFGDPDRPLIELQEFYLLGIGPGAEDEADRRFFARRPLAFVQPAQVQLHWPVWAG